MTYSRIFGLECVRNALEFDFFSKELRCACTKIVTCTITTSMGHNYLAITKITPFVLKILVHSVFP